MEGNSAGFRATLDPTVPLAGLIFRAPTQYYKTPSPRRCLGQDWRDSGEARDAVGCPTLR
ncbi:DUF993 family protein [Ensifer sp. LCM 4579]|uniref:DUF993 family protein n=1 Tax=Ensifer sp. LCM 4579 TaxID=1848292 RepID=UPI0023793EDB|nr:DUF993 family protein [Ensifer sp. LCM 4579]